MEELHSLLSSVEALLQQINSAAASELGRLPGSSQQALAAVQAAIASHVAQVRQRPEQTAGGGDAHVRAGRNTLFWIGVALTGLIALSLLLWAGRSLAEGW